MTFIDLHHWFFVSDMRHDPIIALEVAADWQQELWMVDSRL